MPKWDARCKVIRWGGWTLMWDDAWGLALVGPSVQCGAGLSDWVAPLYILWPSVSQMKYRVRRWRGLEG